MTQTEDQGIWKALKAQKVKMFRSIIRNKSLIGKTKKEIEDMLGKEDNYYDLDEWSYLIKKNIFGAETFLLVHFKGEYAERQRLFTVFSYGTLPLLTI